MLAIEPGWNGFEPACHGVVDQIKSAFEDAFSHDAPLYQWTASSLERTVDSLSLALSGGEHVLSSMLTALYREQNARKPVSRLPLNVMVQIFKATSEVDRWKKPQSYQHLLNVSHTCSAWRQISLAHPDLWTHISLTKMPMKIAWMFLERSAACPLSVECSGRGPCKYLKSFCEAYAERATTVIMALQHPLEQQSLISSLSYENLEQLTVSSVGGSAELDFDAHCMPRLRILDLSKTDFANPPTNLKSLTTLSIAFATKKASNMLNLIAIFRGAPCLRHVVVDKHQESPFYELEHYEGDCVYMDHVQDFCACAGTTDLRWLLSAIVLPESAAVLLRLPLPMDPARIASCFPDDIQHLPRLYNFTRILLDGAKPNGTGPDNQWYIKFLGPLRTPQTNRTHSGIAFYLGQTHWKHSVEILKTIINDPIRRNTNKVCSVYLKDLKCFDFLQRLNVQDTLMGRLPGLPALRFIGCSHSWLYTVQLAFDDYRPTTCFTLQFTKMTICTSDLVLLYEVNESLAKKGRLVLSDCKLRADGGDSWKKDLETIRDLGVRVQVTKNGTITGPVSPA